MSATAKQRIYNHLKSYSRTRAMRFFAGRNQTQPHLSWMEIRFLETLELANKGDMASEVPADQIVAVDPKDATYFERRADLMGREEHFRGLGEESIGNNQLLVVDLAAGMATGFGGTAKGAVQAVQDTRYEDEKGITYLDLKRNNYLGLQRKCKGHIIAAAMVSNETEMSIVENLRKFAEENQVELVLISDGASRETIQKTWAKYKDRWQDSIIAPIIRQPSTLYISKDGKEAGNEYMKGHGDFYDVVQSQLKDLIEIVGTKYLFSSNIDNTGAMISRTILGYFIEQVQQEQIEAIMEAAEKFDGDKGGVPAMIDGTFSVLEEAFVPEEWRDRFLGRDVFPFFNTNTFWLKAAALLSKDFSLPLMITKEIEDNQQTWLKVESIEGHGLNELDWKALIIDRVRFIPAKFITDLWSGRTDWEILFKGRLKPVMRDGRYVPKPLLEVSKNIFGNVAQLNRAIFGYGAYDSMKRLEAMIMGGEGKHFHDLGSYMTNCGVCYEGDNVFIFGHREGQATGRLIVQGSSESDQITFTNCLFYVPPGETRVIKKSRIDAKDPQIRREDLEVFLENAKRWPAKQRERILDKFFPIKNVINFDELLLPKYLNLLDEYNRERLQILSEVFMVQGSQVYEVEFREDEETKGLYPYLKIKDGSKKGIARDYPSRADGKFVRGTSHKSRTISKAPQVIFVDPIDTTAKGEAFKGKYYVAVPNKANNEIILLIGEFDESVDVRKKERAFATKLESLIKFAGDEMTLTDEIKEQIREIFRKIPWPDFFILETGEIYRRHIKPVINPEKGSSRKKS